jgi:Baseplate J-like protein
VTTGIDINTLLTPLDPDVTFNEWMSALETAGIPSSSWATGGPMRTLMRIIANTIVAAWTVILAAISGGFLETATGNWLTLLAFYVYGVTRVQPTQASGGIVFTNSGGGLYGPFSPGSFQVYNPDNDAVYVNTESFTINPSSTTLPIAFQAVVAGSASSSGAGTITQLQTPQPDVTCTNPDALVGLDQQSDTELKTLCMQALGALSMLGVRDAYYYAIRTANDNGQPVNINRSSVSPSSSTGIVTVVVASPSGTPATDDVTAVGTNIEAVARPDTATVALSGATVVTSAQTATVWCTTTAGLDADGLTTLIDAVLDDPANGVPGYPIGGYTKPPSSQGYLFASDIVGWIKEAHSAIYAVDGLADVLIPAGQVVVLDLTLVIRFVNSNAAA